MLRNESQVAIFGLLNSTLDVRQPPYPRSCACSLFSVRKTRYGRLDWLHERAGEAESRRGGSEAVCICIVQPPWLPICHIVVGRRIRGALPQCPSWSPICSKRGIVMVGRYVPAKESVCVQVHVPEVAGSGNVTIRHVDVSGSRPSTMEIPTSQPLKCLTELQLRDQHQHRSRCRGDHAACL